MASFPNNDQNGNDDQQNTNRNNNNNRKFGQVFVNQARRNKLQQGVAADEEQYNRYISQRPQGGSGVLGGRRIENNPNMDYVPDNMAILQAMETMDIDYDEARLLLIMQNEERNVVGNLGGGAEQRRRLLSAKVREREKKKRELREKRIRDAKKKKEDEIQRKKDRARLKGLQNTERKRQQKQWEKQISRSTADKRREARLKTLDKSGSNGNLTKNKVSTQISRTFNNYNNNSNNNNNNNNNSRHSNKKVTAKESSSSNEYWKARAMELVQENQKLQHQNKNMKKNIDILKLQSGQGIIDNANTINSTSHQIHISSEEWYQLLQCDEITREMALQYLFNATEEAEAGNTNYPTISYAITCVKDMINESTYVQDQNDNNVGNMSNVNMNVDNPEMTSLFGKYENNEEDDEEEEEEQDVDMEQKPTPEELRALRLNRYSYNNL